MFWFGLLLVCFAFGTSVPRRARPAGHSALGNFMSQDFDISLRFLCGFVVSANLRNNCWSFYRGIRKSPQNSAILRKTSTEMPCRALGSSGALTDEIGTPDPN